jgi:hypothetical protein
MSGGGSRYVRLDDRKWKKEIAGVILLYRGDGIFRICIKGMEDSENVSTNLSSLILDIATNSEEHWLQFPCITTFNDILFTINNCKIDESFDEKYGKLLDGIESETDKYDLPGVENIMTFRNAISLLFMRYLQEKCIRKPILSCIPQETCKYKSPDYIDDYCGLLRFVYHTDLTENIRQVAYTMMIRINSLDIILLIALTGDIDKGSAVSEFDKFDIDVNMMECISCKIFGR